MKITLFFLPAYLIQDFLPMFLKIRSYFSFVITFPQYTCRRNIAMPSLAYVINIKKHVTSGKFGNSRPKYPEKKKEL